MAYRVTRRAGIRPAACLVQFSLVQFSLIHFCLIHFCLAVGIALLPSAVLAQAYPAKLIRIIIPLAPGAPPDVALRIVAQKMTESIGQPVLVENRSGAAGTIGGLAAARAAPDGYTLFLGSITSVAIGPNIMPSAKFDPVNMLTPISLLSAAPLVMVVPTQLGVNSLSELIDLARAKPGAYNLGSPAVGSMPHIAGEMFKTAAGVDLLHVGFGNPSLVNIAMYNNLAHFNLETMGSLGPSLRSGKLRALAVAHLTRLPEIPNVPTVAEVGFGGLEMASWAGLFAPRGTPPEIIQRLNAEVHKAVALPDVRETLARQGAEAKASTPEELAKLLASDLDRWGKAIIAAGVKAD